MNAFQLFWSFSTYTEAVALIPQFWMLCTMDKIRKLRHAGIEAFLCLYFSLLFLSKTLHICDDVVRYKTDGLDDVISVAAALTQAFITACALLGTLWLLLFDHILDSMV